MRHLRESSDVARFTRICIGVAAAILVNACDPIRTISISRQLDQPPDDLCVLRALQSSEHVKTADRSRDGTLFAELIMPADIDPPWHPDPKRPTRFAVLQSRTKDGKTDLTFRVLWVAGEKGSEEYRRYVEDVLAKLQAATVEACTSRTGGQSGE
jgi:hypothetical protein